MRLQGLFEDCDQLIDVPGPRRSSQTHVWNAERAAQWGLPDDTKSETYGNHVLEHLPLWQAFTTRDTVSGATVHLYPNRPVPLSALRSLLPNGEMTQIVKYMTGYSAVELWRMYVFYVLSDDLGKYMTQAAQPMMRYAPGAVRENYAEMELRNETLGSTLLATMLAADPCMFWYGDVYSDAPFFQQFKLKTPVTTESLKLRKAVMMSLDYWRTMTWTPSATQHTHTETLATMCTVHAKQQMHCGILDHKFDTTPGITIPFGEELERVRERAEHISKTLARTIMDGHVLKFADIAVRDTREPYRVRSFYAPVPCVLVENIYTIRDTTPTVVSPTITYEFQRAEPNHRDTRISRRAEFVVASATDGHVARAVQIKPQEPKIPMYTEDIEASYDAWTRTSRDIPFETMAHELDRVKRSRERETKPKHKHKRHKHSELRGNWGES